MLSVEGCEYFDKGSHRHIYINPEEPTMVLKHAVTDVAKKGSQAEHKIWLAVMEIPELRQWFNPVVSMNPDGSVLKMHKIERATPADKPLFPMQEWMTDAGWKNWGRNQAGNFVLLDYGSPEMYHRVRKIIMKEYAK